MIPNKLRYSSQEINDIIESITAFVQSEKDLGANMRSTKTALRNIIREATNEAIEYYYKFEKDIPC